MSSKSKSNRASSAKKPAKKAASPAKKVKDVQAIITPVTDDTTEIKNEATVTTTTTTTTVVTVVATPPAKKLSVAEAAKAAAERKAVAEAKKLRTAIQTATRSAQSRIGIAPIDAGAVKKTHIISTKGQPCKIVEWRHSKTGKHGHTRVRLTGLSLVAPFAKLECLQPAHVMLGECKVNKGVYQLLSIHGEPKRTPHEPEDKLRAALAEALADMKSSKKSEDNSSDDENDKEEAKKESSEDTDENNDDNDFSDDEEFSGSEEHSGDDTHIPLSSGHARITVDVLDGKIPRRIVCGIDSKMKEELLSSRSSDASSPAGRYVYQITIVEAPVLPASVGRRGLGDGEDLEDKMTFKAAVQLWRRCDPADIPKSYR